MASGPSRTDIVAGAVAFGYLGSLVMRFVQHSWLRDARGLVLPNDYIDVFAAGRMAGAGRAAEVYDWTAHKAAEVAVAGHAFPDYYGWHYPPTLLFVAVALAKLPYVVSFAVWLALTLPLYALAVMRIVDRPVAFLWACAFPAVLWTCFAGQNGFMTAALIGGALVLLERRPLAAGVLIGLLTVKPQFGLLLPVVLVAGGYWRTTAAALVTALVIAAASWLAFGVETWLAFFHSIPHTTEAILSEGRAGWGKLQSAYGLVRWLGASDHTAWATQMTGTLLLAGWLAVMWRGPRAFALKAAALSTAMLLATPYAYIYDYPLLAIAIAFLYRQRGFDPLERSVFGAVCAAIVIFPVTSAPTGFAAAVLVLCLILRRAYALAAFPKDIAPQRI